MQHLIVLPGHSQKNEAWAELVIEHYGKSFDSSFIVTYDHWKEQDAKIDFIIEEEKIRQHVAKLQSDVEIVFFAKSVGSLLAFLVINHGAVSPKHCVFFGIPFDMAADNLFKDSWSPVDSFTLPAIAFHNVEDPTTSYEFTKEALATHAPHIKLVTTLETDHWYGDFARYDEDIKSLKS